MVQCLALCSERHWDIPYWFSTKYRNTFRYAVEIANNHLETCMDKFCKKALAGLWVVAALAPADAAGQTWPTRPISFVVPFTPGGSIGVEAAVRQPPDGYTMIYGTSGTQAANLALYKNIRYDPIKDFVPVHALSATPLVLVVHPERPFKTVPALIAYAKAHPGQLNFGSAGTGTGTHLSAELFQATTGIRMTHVPYKGSSPALTDLMAGNLDLMFDYAAVVLPFVQAGKLRPLAVTSKTRLAAMPDVPGVGELGLPKAEVSAWSAVFLPAQTPPGIAKRLGDAIAQAIADPEMLQATEKFGSLPLKDLRDARLGEFVKTEMVRWRELVQASGAKLE